MKIKKTIGIASAIGSLMLILNACYYDEVIPVEEPVGDVGEMSFSADIVPIFNASCNYTGCHNKGGKAPDLSAANAFNSLTNGGYVDTTNPESSSLYLWMTGKKGTPMPLSGPNATYNAKVLAWIEQGALNN